MAGDLKGAVEEKSLKVGLEGKLHLTNQGGALAESECCWVEVNLATLICWGYYQF